MADASRVTAKLPPVVSLQDTPIFEGDMQVDLMAGYVGVRQRREDEMLFASASAMAAEAGADQGIVQRAGEIFGEAADIAGDVALDVGRGLIEAPEQALGGIVDGFDEAAQAVAEAGDWLSANLGDGIVTFDIPFVPDDQTIGLNPEDITGAVQEAVGQDEADSVAGGIVRDVSQFLAGFGVAGKALKGVQATTGIGKAAKLGAQGMIADGGFFDPQEDGLADLVQKYPDLQNPIAEYLAGDDDDTQLEARLKKSFEGLGFGLLAEGGVRALSATKRVLIAKAAKGGTSMQAATDEMLRPGMADNAFADLDGTMELTDRAFDPSVGRPAHGNDVAQARGLLAAKREDGDFAINFARIDSADDVKDIMQTMADNFTPDIEKAARGVQTNAETVQMSRSVDAFQTLMQRRQGQPMNAEETFAARTLYTSSAQKLGEIAQAAAREPTAENLFKFRKMYAVHAEVQREVMAARRETARALQSWRIPAGGSREQMRHIEGVVNNFGGRDVNERMAKEIAGLFEGGDMGRIDDIVERGALMRTLDAVQETWMLGLLSGPKTHIVNIASNAGVVAQQLYERATAGAIRTGDGVADGEAMSQLIGMLGGFKDAARFAARSMRTQQTGYFLDEVSGGATGSKLDTPYTQKMSAEYLDPALSKIGLRQNTMLGRTAGGAIDAIGSVYSLPGRALAGTDEFFKTLNYRGELRARATRQVADEVRGGKLAEANRQKRFIELIEDPPEDLRIIALQQAEMATFTKELGVRGKAFQQSINRMGVMGRFVLPFIKTPVNIAEYTLERTPLAPLFEGWRRDIAKGGADADLALARMGLGTMFMAFVAEQAMEGHVSGAGPSDRRQMAAMRRNGWQPNSVRLGDRWYAYNRLDPYGMVMGLAANAAEFVTYADWDDDDLPTIDEISAAVVGAIGNTFSDKTFISGGVEFMTAMTGDQWETERFLERFAGSFVPSALNEAARFSDPYLRAADGYIESAKRRIPGMSEDMPPVRDLWGREVDFRSGLGWAYDMMSPIYSRREDPSPIDEEMLRLDKFVSKQSNSFSFDGARINLKRYPEVKDLINRMLGNEIKLEKYGGLGMFDAMNALVTGELGEFSRDYESETDGPDGGKAKMLDKIRRSYSGAAREALAMGSPLIGEMVATIDNGVRQDNAISQLEEFREAWAAEMARKDAL
ncbi:MAG: hypothetical protein AAF205_00270 [Pseudomonadota bacterium]